MLPEVLEVHLFIMMGVEDLFSGIRIGRQRRRPDRETTGAW